MTLPRPDDLGPDPEPAHPHLRGPVFARLESAPQLPWAHDDAPAERAKVAA